MSADPEFEEVVKRYYHELYRFGFSLTGTEGDARDLTQQTFYIWARKGDQLRDRAKVKTWLFTTLHREFLKIKRRLTRFPHETINEAVQDLPHVPAACLERLDAQTLVLLLGELDEGHRAVLVLYYLEDLSYKEIGEMLSIPLGTVQSRISRAKAQLLRRLRDTQFTTRER